MNAQNLQVSFMNKRKVLIIIDSLDSLGGTQNYSKKLQLELNSNNYFCEILSLKSSIEARYSLNLRYNFQSIFFNKKLNKIVSDFDYTVVVSGHIFGYLSFSLRNKNVIWRESNNPVQRNRSKSFIKNQTNKLLYNYFLITNKDAKIILPSLQCNSKALGKLKVYIINNFINFLPTAATKSNKKNTFKFISCGRWNLQKGSDRLMHIFHNSLFTLNFFGEKVDLDAKFNIKFHGTQNLSKIYSQSDCLLLLSRFEGYPNVINEARASGCSLILSQENAWLKEINIISDNIIFIGSDDEIRSFIERNDVNNKRNFLTDKEINSYNLNLTNQIISLFD